MILRSGCSRKKAAAIRPLAGPRARLYLRWEDEVWYPTNVILNAGKFEFLRELDVLALPLAVHDRISMSAWLDWGYLKVSSVNGSPTWWRLVEEPA